MRLNHWLNRLRPTFISRPSTRRRGVRPRRFGELSSPAIESLEPRQLLTTFLVNTFADTVDANPGDGIAADANGDTSLRAAIMEANAWLGHDTIELPAGNYVLSLAGTGENAAVTGDLDVVDDLTIEGAGQGTAVIDANQIDRVFDIHNGAALNLFDLTVTGGQTSGVAGDEDGGGIRINDSALAINRVTVTANEAVNGDGGGIFGDGVDVESHVDFSTVSSNVAAGSGGGIRLQPPIDWTGGANVRDSTVADNIAGEFGGGLALFALSANTNDISFVRSTFSGNSAGDDGGGIVLGFGISDVLPASGLSNLTISGNTAGDAGGGIYLSLDFSVGYFLTQSTITDNTARIGGGVFANRNGAPRSVALRNSIVYGNTGTEGQPDVGADSPSDDAYFGGESTIIGDPAGSTNFDDALVGVDPMLGPLADNGGPTFTHALLPGSPAIDAGDNTNAPSTDQRGFTRIVDGDGDGTATADIGAFELHAIPTPVAPLGIVFDLQPEFQWAPAENADFYELQVDDLTAGMPLVIDETNIAGTSFLPGMALPDGHMFAWRVRAVSSGLPGTWSADVTFSTDSTAAPVLTTLPAVIFDATPTFTWTGVGAAARYEIEVNDLTAPQNGIIHEDMLTDTSFTPATPLPAHHEYQWRVRAIRADNTPGEWSPFDTFQVSQDAPTLLAPLGKIFDFQPTFEWTAVPDADHYKLVVQRGPATIIEETLSGTQFTPMSELEAGFSYTWSVRAADSAGNAGPAAEGSFDTRPVSTPVIVGPKGTADNLYGQVFTTHPTFEWEAVPHAVHYDIWVNNLTTGQIAIIRENVAGTQFVPADPLPVGHAYVWTVRAIGPNSMPGIFATHAYFQVRDSSVSPTLMAPVSGTPDTTPTFQWTEVPMAQSYDIWVNDLNTGESGIIRTVVGTNSFTPTTPLTPGHAYIWTVRGIFPDGNGSEWAAHRTFRVTFDTPTLLAPPSVVNTATPEFQWTAVPGADHYDLWVNDLTTGQSGVIRENVAGTSFTPSVALTMGHDYIWTVAAVASDGWAGAQAPHRIFLVQPPAGLDVTLVDPEGLTLDTTPTFQWTAAPNADHYDLWVNDLTTGQSGILRNTNVSGTSFTPTTPLPAGHSFIWTVRAIAADGTVGLQATHKMFAIARSTDLEVALIGPTSPTIDATPTFRWTAAPGAARYDLWVNDQTTGQSGIIRNTNVTGTSFTPSTPLPAGHSFIWTVRAIAENGLAGDQAAHRVFSVRPDLTPILLAPPPLPPTATPTFTWTAIVGAARYDLWVNNLTTGQSAVIRNTNITGTSFVPTTPLISGHRYIWTVAGITDDGVTAAQAPHRTFRIAASAAPLMSEPNEEERNPGVDGRMGDEENDGGESEVAYA